MKGLFDSEGIFLEPSACAGFSGAARLAAEARDYLQAQKLDLARATQIIWATGGALVPELERAQYLAQGAQVLTKSGERL